MFFDFASFLAAALARLTQTWGSQFCVILGRLIAKIDANQVISFFVKKLVSSCPVVPHLRLWHQVSVISNSSCLYCLRHPRCAPLETLERVAPTRCYVCNPQGSGSKPCPCHEASLHSSTGPSACAAGERATFVASDHMVSDRSRSTRRYPSTT